MKKDEELKRISSIIIAFLATLVLFTSVAYSSEPQIAETSPRQSPAPNVVENEPLETSTGNEELSLVYEMIDLLSTDLEYQLNESATVVLACDPFAGQPTDDRIYQPSSNISVGLKFSW